MSHYEPRPAPISLPPLGAFQTFKGYWTALAPEQAMALAVGAHGQAMTPEEFVTAFCHPESEGVTFYAEDPEPPTEGPGLSLVVQ